MVSLTIQAGFNLLVSVSQKEAEISFAPKRLDESLHGSIGGLGSAKSEIHSPGNIFWRHIMVLHL
jgi:hypothetical protein